MEPALSVVLATDTYATILPVIERFRQQTIRERLEIVLVVPEREAASTEILDLSEFAAVRVVAVEGIVPLAAARGEGVRAATAPLVFLGETHSFPRDDLAEALVRAHASPWAVVVPAFENANPDGALSWAAFLFDYGLWAEGRPPGEIDRMPGYNVAYRRSVLLKLGNRLERVLAQGDELVIALRAQEQHAYFEPRARIEHANISYFAPWVRQRFLVGRVIGSTRGARWGPFRRLVYVCGSPLIPAVLLFRMIGPVRWTGRRRRLPAGTMPAMILGSVLKAAGEMVGYARGESASAGRRVDEYEVQKISHTSLRSVLTAGSGSIEER